MAKRETLFWVLGSFLLLSFAAAVSIPNLLRSRMAANESVLVAKSRISGGAVDRKSEKGLSLQASATEKKVIHNAELALVVSDVRHAADEIRRLTVLNRGEVDKLEIIETSGGFLSATIAVRVPASGLEEGLTNFKHLAVRTEREQVGARDVTGEFYDNEAHLRNLQAEEQQYLAIMRRAVTIKDTLGVSEKLSDVRDRVERLQTQIQIMTHDIEMSLVNIALMQEADAEVLGIHWRPLYSAKIATHELLAGLGGWADWVVAVLIKLPLIALWALTIGAILWLLWAIGRSAWSRFSETKVRAHQ